jgi:hypothetical protein
MRVLQILPTHPFEQIWWTANEIYPMRWSGLARKTPQLIVTRIAIDFAKQRT